MGICHVHAITPLGGSQRKPLCIEIIHVCIEKNDDRCHVGGRGRVNHASFSMSALCLGPGYYSVLLADPEADAVTACRAESKGGRDRGHERAHRQAPGAAGAGKGAEQMVWLIPAGDAAYGPMAAGDRRPCCRHLLPAPNLHAFPVTPADGDRQKALSARSSSHRSRQSLLRRDFPAWRKTDFGKIRPEYCYMDKKGI